MFFAIFSAIGLAILKAFLFPEIISTNSPLSAAAGPPITGIARWSILYFLKISLQYKDCSGEMVLESATIRRFGFDATIPFFPNDTLFIASMFETHIKIKLQSSAISLGLFATIAPLFAKG